MGHINLLLTLLFSMHACGNAQRPDLVKLVVGQPFQYEFPKNWKNLEVKDASGEELPRWLIWKSTERLLEGIPQLEDVGKSYLRVTHASDPSTVLEISVSEESKNACGLDHNTLWMEVAFDVALKELSIAKQMRLIESITEYFDVNSALLRLYSNKYKDEIRRSEVIESGMQHEATADRTTVLWKVSCEEVDEEAIEVLERVLSLDESEVVTEQKLIGWKLTKGMLLSRKQRKEGTGSGIVSEFSGFATNEPFEPAAVTVLSKTVASRTSRTTKKSDNLPVRLNSLPTFRCKRGSLCEFSIPKETFMDAEDGDTRSLTLSVHAIRDKKWLALDRSGQTLHGIPLEQGDYEYRLEARDAANQMTSAPFRVTVEESSPTNHVFTLEVQQNYDRMKEPETLYAFTEKLANSLGDRYPKHIVIRSLKNVSTGRTLVAFSNGTLSHKLCQKKAIDAIKYMMLTKKRDRVRNDFVRAMDSRFHVRNARLQLLGSCAEQMIVPTEFDDSVFTTTEATGIDTMSSYIWLLIALIALAMLFITLLVIVCILRRKKTKSVQSEYISKGMPVVFPEEIPQEDDIATVSTPMLVKEERPPLIVSQHENPLYKPPPPISTASSPRPRNSATNQRQPPPYVPP